MKRLSFLLCLLFVSGVSAQVPTTIPIEFVDQEHVAAGRVVLSGHVNNNQVVSYVHPGDFEPTQDGQPAQDEPAPPDKVNTGLQARYYNSGGGQNNVKARTRGHNGGWQWHEAGSNEDDYWIQSYAHFETWGKQLGPNTRGGATAEGSFRYHRRYRVPVNQQGATATQRWEVELTILATVNSDNPHPLGGFLHNSKQRAEAGPNDYVEATWYRVWPLPGGGSTSAWIANGKYHDANGNVQTIENEIIPHTNGSIHQRWTTYVDKPKGQTVKIETSINRANIPKTDTNKWFGFGHSLLTSFPVSGQTAPNTENYQWVKIWPRVQILDVKNKP